MHLSSHLSIHLSIDLSIHRSVYLSIYWIYLLNLSIYLSIYLSSNRSIVRCFYLSISLSFIWKEPIMGDLLHKWKLARPKRSNPARLVTKWKSTPPKRRNSGRQYLALATLKTEAILPGFLEKWEVECRAGGAVPMRIAIFPFRHVSKALRMPRKSDARSCEVLRLSRKIILVNPQIPCSKKAIPLRKSAPWPPNMSDDTSLVLRLPCDMDPLQSSHACHRFLSVPQNPHVLLTFGEVENRLRLPCITTSQVVRDRRFLTLLTSKWTLLRALFRHLNFQKWWQHLVFPPFEFDMCFVSRARFRHINE